MHTQAWNGVLAARAEKTAWLGSGTECSSKKDLVSCGNERVRTGALDWTWSGASDSLCDGETWQMYRQLKPDGPEEMAAGAADSSAQYPPISCADLDPVGFIASYFSTSKRQYCTQECPGMWPETRWGKNNIESAMLPARQYGPLADQRKTTLDLRPHLSGVYRVVRDAECTLTAEDFEYELSTGAGAEELRTRVKELVLHHDHRRLKDLPSMFKKFKGDEARLYDLLKQLFVEGRTEVNRELGEVVGEAAALDGAQPDGSSGPLLTPHRGIGADGLLAGWTRLDAAVDRSAAVAGAGAGGSKGGGASVDDEEEEEEGAAAADGGGRGGSNGAQGSSTGGDETMVWEIPRASGSDTPRAAERGDEGEDTLPELQFTVRKIREGTQKLLRVSAVMPKVNEASEVEIGARALFTELSLA